MAGEEAPQCRVLLPAQVSELTLNGEHKGSKLQLM